MTVVVPWYRLGYIIPHRHTDMDGYQFARVAPDGMMLVTTQLDLAEYSVEAVERELPAVGDGIDVLATRVDSISISGVPLAASLGRARMLGLLADAAQRAGIETLTDLEAHILALHHLGADHIAMATRWPEALNEKIIGYLAESGIDVLAHRAEQRDLQRNKRADPLEDHELALRLGREVLDATPSAKALLLPGGLWFAIHAAPVLEREYGVPVLLNITSTTWAALRHRAGSLLHPVPEDSGRLLATL